MFANYAFINHSTTLLITFHDYVGANGHSPLRVILSYCNRSNRKTLVER